MVANHWSNELSDEADKVYARDLFRGTRGEGTLFGGDSAGLNRGVHRLALVRPSFSLVVR